MRTAVLLSGGIDSAALAAHCLRRGDRVVPVYVAGGLRWEAVERYWASRLLKAMRHRRLSGLRVLRLDQRDLYSPRHWALSGRAPSRKAAWDSVGLKGRNLLLLSKAAAADDLIDRIAIGSLEGNPFLDARPAFFRALERAFREGFGRPIRVDAPFLRTTKASLLRRFPGLPYRLTFSCIRPKGRRHCGRCTKCGERSAAFAAAGVADPAPRAG